jgi:hypothetical protein
MNNVIDRILAEDIEALTDKELGLALYHISNSTNLSNSLSRGFINKCIRRASEILENLPEEGYSNTFRLTPWASSVNGEYPIVIDENPDFDPKEIYENTFSMDVRPIEGVNVTFDDGDTNPDESTIIAREYKSNVKGGQDREPKV